MDPTAPLTWTPPDVHHELWGALLLGACFLALFATAERLRRRMRLPTEVTRKLVHTLSGVVALLIPHVFTSLYSVLVVGGSFLALMAFTKVCRLLPSVHQIGRRTTGAVVYPIAIVALLLLTGGRPVLFEVPLLILACADAAAALVGKAIGRRRYLVWGHVRTLEGSYAFLATSFVIVFVALAIGVAQPADVGTAILVAFVLSLFLTAVEALSTGGWDNFAIPVAGYVGLRSLLHAGPAELVGFLAVAVLFVVGFMGLWLAKRAITVALLRVQNMGGVFVLRLAWFVPLALFVVAQALVARAVPVAGGRGLAASAPLLSAPLVVESNQ
jgi:dolichol kinase